MTSEDCYLRMEVISACLVRASIAFLFAKTTVYVMDVTKPFAVPGKELALFLHDSKLMEELLVVDVADDEYVLHYEDNRCKSVLKAGKHAYWKSSVTHTFTRLNTLEIELPATLKAADLMKLNGLYSTHEVAGHERGFLFYDNVFAAGAWSRQIPLLAHASYGIRSNG